MQKLHAGPRFLSNGCVYIIKIITPLNRSRLFLKRF